MNNHFSVISIPTEITIKKPDPVSDTPLGHTGTLSWENSWNKKNEVDYVEWSPVLKIVNLKNKKVSITSIIAKWKGKNNFGAISDQFTIIEKADVQHDEKETKNIHFPLFFNEHETKHVRMGFRMNFIENISFKLIQSNNLKLKNHIKKTFKKHKDDTKKGWEIADRVYGEAYIRIITNTGQSEKIKL